jgi:hypothetical protein
MVRNLLSQLSPPVQAAMSPLVQRWETYVQKVSGRVEEILVEGDQGITEILQMNPQDPGPVSAAFTAVESRFRGITDKVDSAREKIEEDWEETVENLGLEDPAQERTLRMMWNAILQQSDAFKYEIFKKSAALRIRKMAEWSKALYQTAMQEYQQPRHCPSCGAQIEVAIRYQASNVTCPFCNAVNTIEVGPATGLYFQGAGVHSLAEEENIQQYMAWLDTERWYNDLRNPTAQDRERMLGAARTYWTAYYTTMKRLHPGFQEDIAAAVSAKLAHYDAYDRKADQGERSVYGNIVELAASRDQNRLWQYLQSLPESQLDMDDAVRAVYEHGDRDGAVLLMRMQHRMENEEEPIDSYIKEKLADLDEG